MGNLTHQLGRIAAGTATLIILSANGLFAGSATMSPAISSSDVASQATDATANTNRGTSLSYTINGGWQFRKISGQEGNGPVTTGTAAEKVNLPHSWNVWDSQDDTPGFWRGLCEYTKDLRIPSYAEGKRVFLHFVGANQETRIFVGDALVKEHKGGYTMFSAEISDYVKAGEDCQLRIEVDNSHNADIPPLSADFTFFGGIYRDVRLVIKEPVHISILDKATEGVYVSTPSVSRESAEVNVKTLVNSSLSTKSKVFVQNILTAPDGTKTVLKKVRATLEPSSLNNEVSAKFSIANPQLWSPDSPALYSLTSTLLDAKGNVLDEQTVSFGLRWFHFDADKGFFLNGEHLKLIGTNRHQCFLDKGYALDDSYHINDIRMIKEMGSNFIRVSHYPQDPLVLEMCDKLGLLTSVEIPIVNAVTESDAFAENCVEMAEEMVKQSYNHPSVVIWAYMNEVMLRPPYKRNTAEYSNYCKEAHRQAVMIEQRIRETDPYRYTMIPCNGDPRNYEDADLLSVPMTTGWNLYKGWYSETVYDLDDFFAKLHKKYPDMPLMMTEYGADNDIRIHSTKPESFDYSVEYADFYQEYYLDYVQRTPYLAGAFLWNYNEFYSEPRTSAVPHVNLKGVVTLDRKPKNTYLLYKANLTDKPMLEFGDWYRTVRSGQLNDDGIAPEQVTLYSNLAGATVLHNGKELCKVEFKDGKARFTVPFVDGENRLTAYADITDNNGFSENIVSDNTATEKGKDAATEKGKDAATGKGHGSCAAECEKIYAELNVEYHGIPAQLKDGFTDLNVLLGSNRSFDETDIRLCWIAEKKYSEGSWGYVGGEAYRPGTSRGSLPAAEINILGTDNDPMYQTQRRGIESFKADVPNGKYAVYLHWAELVKPLEEALAYNLGRNSRYEEGSDRCFDVAVCGKTILERLNVMEEVGAATPLVVRTDVDVKDGKGIKIDFTPVKGDTFLTAVRIVRID